MDKDGLLKNLEDLIPQPSDAAGAERPQIFQYKIIIMRLWVVKPR